MKLISKVIKKIEGEKRAGRFENDISFKPKKKKRVIYVLLLTVIFSLIAAGGYFLWSNILNDSYSSTPKPRRDLSERLKKAKKETPVPSFDKTAASKVDSTITSPPGEKTDLDKQSSSVPMEKIQIGKKAEAKKEKPSVQPSLAKTAPKVDSIVLFQSQNKTGTAKISESSSVPEAKTEEIEEPPTEKQFSQKVDKTYQVEKSETESPVLNIEKKLPDIKSSQRDELVLTTPLSKGDPRDGSSLSPKERNQLVNNYFNFGLKSHKTGKIGEAEECYHKALELDPYFYPAHLNLSTIYLEKGKLVEAEKELSRLLSQKPEEPKAMYNYALLCYRKKDFKKAEEFLEKLLIADNQNSKAYLLKGKILEEQNNLEEAILAYLEAFQLNPDVPDILYTLGRAKDMEGDKKEALTYYQLFLKNFSEGNSDLERSVRERIIFLKSGGIND